MTASVAFHLGPPAKEEFLGCGLEHRTGTPHVPEGDGPVLRAIARLAPGEAVRVSLDHEPEPLLAIVAERYPGRFRWEPFLEGPARWVGLFRRRASDDPRASLRRLPSRLVRRIDQIGARARLEGELRAIAEDLVGPLDDVATGGATGWSANDARAAVATARELALAVLVERLDALLAVAPADVARRLDAVTARRDAGIL